MVPYNGNEIDTKKHNHRYPTQFSLSQEAYSCVLKSQKSEIACGIIDDHRVILKYRHLIQKLETKKIWENSMSNEISRLSQG